MENQIQPENTQVVQPVAQPPAPPSSNLLKILLFVLLGLLFIVGVVFTYTQIIKRQTTSQSVIIEQSISPSVQVMISPNPVPSPSEPSTSSAACKQVGEIICINTILCPDETSKCCPGLLAVIESRSTAKCQPNTQENASKPRVESLEQ